MDRHRSFCVALAFALVAMCSLTATNAAAQEEEARSLTREGSTGAGAAILNLVYAPLKMAYASGGLVISGLAWCWTGGDTSISGPIYRAAVGGDYVITPDHVSRDESVTFAKMEEY
jgi:hypothetical protein